MYDARDATRESKRAKPELRERERQNGRETIADGRAVFVDFVFGTPRDGNGEHVVDAGHEIHRVPDDEDAARAPRRNLPGRQRVRASRQETRRRLHRKRAKMRVVRVLRRPFRTRRRRERAPRPLQVMVQLAETRVGVQVVAQAFGRDVSVGV